MTNREVPPEIAFFELSKRSPARKGGEEGIFARKKVSPRGGEGTLVNQNLRKKKKGNRILKKFHQKTHHHRPSTQTGKSAATSVGTAPAGRGEKRPISKIDWLGEKPETK